jgi:RND family efflux transporter MFP subunit
MSIDSEKKSNQKGCFYKIINILFVIGLIVAAYWAYQAFFGNPEGSDSDSASGTSQEETVENSTNGDAIEVETMEISENPLSRINFQKVGTVTPYKSATLTAEASGVLQDFKVEEGDLVTEDDEIVEVSDSVSTEIAQINYDNALTSLENAKKSYSGTSSSVAQDAQIASIGIESAKLNYDNAILAKENLEQTLEEQIRSAKIGIQAAQLGLQAAQEAYFNTDATTNIGLDNTLDQSLSSMNSTLSLIDNSVDSVNGLLAMQATLGSDVRSSDIEDLQDYSEDVFDDYLDLRDEYYDVQGTRDLQDTKNLLTDTLNLIEDAQEMLQDSKDIVDDSDTDLSTLNISFNSLLASLDQSKNGLYMTSQSLESVALNTQLQPEGTMTSVSMAQQQVASALQQLKQLEETREAQLDNAQHGINLAAKQIDVSESQYLNTLAKGNLQKIGSENQVASIEGQVDIAKANLGGTILTAPFDGTILEKFLDEGNFVNPSQKVVTVANLSKVYITVNLTAEELSFVKLGQAVSIMAPGGIEKEGKVSKVLPSVDPVSKQVKVKILIPNEEDELISGMFADVVFQDAQSASPRLLIPFKSIIFEQSAPYVYIVQNNKAVKTSVTLGETSGSEVEIIDGLSQGDKIITIGAKIVKDGDSITSTNN